MKTIQEQGAAANDGYFRRNLRYLKIKHYVEMKNVTRRFEN